MTSTTAPLTTNHSKKRTDTGLSSTQILSRALVVVIGLLFALGLAGSYYIKKTDVDYSRLVQTSIAGFKSLQELNRHSIRGYAALASLQSAGDPAAQASLLAQSDHEVAANDKIVAGLSAHALQEEARGALVKVKSSRSEYQSTRTTYLDLIKQGDLSAAQVMSMNTLTPAYLQYLEATGEFSATLEAQTLSLSRKLTDETTRVSRIILIIAAVPVLFAIGLSVLLSLFWLSLKHIPTEFDLSD